MDDVSMSGRNALPSAAIFLHIPRTAGTTLNDILDRQCLPSERWALGPQVQEALRHLETTPAEERARIRIAYGHMPYGLHRLLPGNPRYFTILRDPIDRTISFYHYVTEENDHYLHDFTQVTALTLADFIASRVTTTVDNFGVRMLSGAWHDVPFGELTTDHLELAQENLRNMAVVGLTERFDETLLLLRKAFGWGDVTYERLNVTAHRPRVAEISAADRLAAESVNILDAALYQEGAVIFAKAIAEQGPSFPAELARFRQRNRSRQRLRQLRRTAQHLAERLPRRG
jgi:hypothetical protein